MLPVVTPSSARETPPGQPHGQLVQSWIFCFGFPFSKGKQTTTVGVMSGLALFLWMRRETLPEGKVPGSGGGIKTR